MKIANRDIKNFLNNIPSNNQGILLYGPDVGLTLERIKEISNKYNSHQKYEISEEDIASNPTQILDIASSISLFQENGNLIIVKNAKDSYVSLINKYLDQNLSGNIILFEAKELATSSKLRQLFEKDMRLAAIPAYLESESSVRSTVVETLRQFNIRYSRDALLYIVNNLGSDYAITKRELEKIVLYKANSQTELSLQEVAKLIDDSSSVAINKVHFSLFNFYIEEAYKEVSNILEQEGAIFLIRALANHTKRLITAKHKHNDGENLDKIIDSTTPMIFFMYKDKFKQQILSWNIEKLEELSEKLISLEIEAKRNPDIANIMAMELVSSFVNTYKSK